MLDERRLRRVLEVGRMVVSELDLEAVLQQVLDEARELTGASYAALGILEEHRQELERFLSGGIDPETHAAIGDLPLARGVLGVLISDPVAPGADDAGGHSGSSGFALEHPPTRSFLGVPILVRGETYGNLYLTDKQGAAAFDAADEEAMVLLASWAGVAIGNARAYLAEQARRRELEQAVRALEATTAIAHAVGGETDLGRVLELIVKRARALVDARGLAILLQEGDDLVVSAVAGPLRPDLPGTRVPIEGSASGGVLRSRRPERVSNLQQRLRFRLAEEVDARSGLMVPLLFRGRAVGVLAAFDRGDGAEFSAEDERLLNSFASSAATAVATAQNVAAQGLRRSIESSERERQRWARELHDQTLQELAGLKLLLSVARLRDDPDAIEEALEAGVVQLTDSIAGLRRLIADLRPAALDVLGTKAALEGLAERVTEASGLRVALHVELAFEDRRVPERHPAVVEDALYRIVQEALTNVVKHATASRIDVRVIEDEHGIVLTVSDDGIGFDADQPTEGFGMIGMRERVELVDGTLTVQAGASGGTTVRASIPPAAQPGRLGTRLSA